jgi:hypothetical protein
VLLSGPFTQQIHQVHCWRDWVSSLGGGTVYLVWVRSDAATLLHRMTARGSERDAAKLAGFEAFTLSMRLDAELPVPYLEIDNRLTATAPLAEQVSALVATLAQR